MERKLEVIEIGIPKPTYIRWHPKEGEGLSFGRHILTLNKNGDETIRKCDGNMTLEETTKFHGIMGRDGEWREECYIRCSQCSLILSIGLQYQKAVWEWMRIVLGAAISQLKSLLPRDKFGDFWPINQEPSICLPETILQSKPFFEHIRGIYPNWWGDKRDPKEGWPWNARELPMWRDHGIVVAQITEFNTTEGLHALLFIALHLMDDLEKSFQDAIKKSAQLASSTSEVYHPTTRRPRNKRD